MRILFDCSSLFRNGRVESGVPSYTLSLIEMFKRLPHEVVFFYSGRKRFGLENYVQEYAHLPIPSKLLLFLSFCGVRLDWLIRKRLGLEFDVYFTPNVVTFYRHLSSRIKVVGVVHDISHVLFPEMKPVPERLKYFWQTRTHAIERVLFLDNKRKSIIERFHHFVAISEHTKRDLVEFAYVSEEKITVIYPALHGSLSPVIPNSDRESKQKNQQSRRLLGVGTPIPTPPWGRDVGAEASEQKDSKSFGVSVGFLDSSSRLRQDYGGQANAGMTEGVLERYVIQKPYLLFLGHIEPRKNVENLIRSFVLLKKEHPALQLIIAGRQGYEFRKLLNVCKELDLSHGVIARSETTKQSPDNARYDEIASPSLAMTNTTNILFIGHITDEEKYVLMQKAEVFVYPSLYEGFAYPCLEAMSVGTPVVTSPVSALPEVLGGAALYADPLRPESIATVVSEVLNDPQLRDRLIGKGREYVKRFHDENATLRQWVRLFEKI